MQFRCLGAMAAFDAGQSIVLGGPKQRLVLAHLLVNANEVVTVDRLIGAVWGDEPPPAARSSLHSYVSHLRKALGAERIESRGQGYVLRVAGDEVDRMRFEALLAEGRRRRTSDPGAAAALLRNALELWQGPPFADLGGTASLQPAIARLEELRLAAIEDRVDADLDRGLDRELVGELESLTGANPLRERLWCQLMVALYRSDRQGDALAAYERARSMLADELGVDPSQGLRSMHERVLRQDPSLHAGVPALKGYQLIERLGEGRFGTVWRATQPGVDREVAVKAARADLANSPAFIRRFDVDAQRVARIEHPHVVPLYDFWREPGGAYLVMRLLRGGDVRRLLDTTGPPDHQTGLRIVGQVAEALAAAHDQGVVHGNIKPSNVLFDGSGNAFLSDFAIARAEGSTGPAVPPAELPYLAPDRIAGAAANARSDVYALGILMSALLPTANSAVADVVQRATAGDPRARPRDATELLTELRAAVPATATPDARPTARLATAAPAAAMDGLRNPYKGLSAFTEGDAADYFGREAFVARLLARLREDGPAGRFLAVVGPSGSGKSSVVRAGLVPALRAGALPASREWYVAQMVPGDRPFEELAAALRQVAVDAPDGLAAHLAGDDGITRTVGRVLPDGGQLLLVIDQFEELFTLVADGGHRRRFIDTLVPAVCEPGGYVRVVVTLRADFYDRPLEYSGLAELLQARTEAVTPLTVSELERAVTGPAERVGVTVERPLVAQMAADVADQPGALPLLQYALTELFDGREDGVLSTAAYHRIGGIAGALARRAEAVFSGLSTQAREAARQLLLRLVAPGEGVEDTRRRATVAEVTALAPEHMPAVLSAFGEARLLAFDRDADTRAATVEVAHEALLREWRRLRGWIDAARDDLRTQRRLQVAATDWAAAERDPSFLATGARLEQYETWRATSSLVVNTLEREYLDASSAYRDRIRAEDAARQEREQDLERRSVRRLRTLVVVLAAAAVTAGGLTVFAVTQAQRAAAQAQVASARELSAAAVANLDIDADRSMLLAMEAVDRTRGIDGTVLREAEEALHQAVVASRVEMRLPDLGGAVDWSGDGRFLITEGPEESGVLDLRDAATGRSVRSFHGHDVDINDVVFSNDGTLLASTGYDGALRVWDPGTGVEVVSFEADASSGKPIPVFGPSVAPAADLVAAAWPAEGVVRVIDVASGDVRSEIEIDNPSQTAFSPDGTQIGIATHDPGGTGIVVDLDSGERVLTLDHGTDVFDIDWSPDGRWISTSTFLSVAHLFDAATGEPRFTLYGHSAPVLDTAWSADSMRLATASDDGTAKVWAISDGGAQEVRSLAAHDTVEGLVGVAFSPDGRRLLTGDRDVGTATVWDIGVGGDAEWTNVAASPDAKTSVAFTPDGHVVATGSDATATMWDATTGQRIRTFGADDQPADQVAVSNDGAFVAGATEDGSVAAWDSDTGEQAWSLRRDEPILDLAMGSGQHLVAVSGEPGGVRIYDRLGRQVYELDEGADRTVWTLAFTADGRYLAVSSSRDQPGPGADRVRIWDLEQREVVQKFDPGPGGIDFDPAGDRIVTARAGVGGIWDVEEGEQLVRLTGHTGDIYETAFSNDGALVATAGYDGTVRVWDATSGTQRLVLRGHDAVVTEVAFSPDDSRLVSGADGTVRVWALDLDDLIAIAQDEVTRQLTDEECREYLHLDECPAS